MVHAATDVSLTVSAGRVLALVGESGCGKSVLAAAILGLLPANAQVRGRVDLSTEEGPLELLRCPEHQLVHQVRGRRVGLVPQSAATHLTPVRTARSQLVEVVRAHVDGVVPLSDTEVDHRVDELTAMAGLAEHHLDRYPHELSGGMASRVVLALALAGDPDVIVADEPTAGLDPDLVRSTVDQLRELADKGRGVLLITHDLGAAERVADDLAVMYAGRLVEAGPASDVLADPWHDYTRGLLGALPRHGLMPIPGRPAELTNPRDGCAFHQRCPDAGPCSGDPRPRPVNDRLLACQTAPSEVASC